MSRPEEVPVPVELLLQLDSPELSKRSSARDRLLDLVPPPGPEYTDAECQIFYCYVMDAELFPDDRHGQARTGREMLQRLHDAGYARLERL